MRFSPQRRAILRHPTFEKCSEDYSFLTFWLQNVLFATAASIFRHHNFKKCSETVSFLAFSLQNVFFATASCIFSTSHLQKVLRNWRVLYIFTSKCAFRHSGLQKVLRDRQFFSIFTSKCVFRHSGVQFLISPLSSDLRTRRFNRPTFRLTRHTNHWKNTAFRDFSNIWRGCIFFLLTFALLHLLSADLTTLLCFSTVYIVGSFYLNFLGLYTPTFSTFWRNIRCMDWRKDPSVEVCACWNPKAMLRSCRNESRLFGGQVLSKCTVDMLTGVVYIIMLTNSLAAD